MKVAYLINASSCVYPYTGCRRSSVQNAVAVTEVLGELGHYVYAACHSCERQVPSTPHPDVSLETLAGPSQCHVAHKSHYLKTPAGVELGINDGLCVCSGTKQVPI